MVNYNRTGTYYVILMTDRSGNQYAKNRHQGWSTFDHRINGHKWDYHSRKKPALQAALWWRLHSGRPDVAFSVRKVDLV